MNIKALLCATVLILLSPFHLFAWGRVGHQIVAQLAMYQLSDETLVKVLKVLGNMTPKQAGTWMDDVRSEQAYKYMVPWHYTNIEPGAIYKPAAAGDIITDLNKAYRELQRMDTLSPERLRFDVLVLMHLCGDLTQPLHVGCGSDKGGNNYQVRYNGKGTNLHHILDSEIIKSQGITLASLLGDEPPPIAGESPTQVLRKVSIDFAKQLEDRRNILSRVYDIKGRKLDEAYMKKAGPLVHDQLIRGGYLLAACLEQVFSQAKNIPIVKEPTSTKQQANPGDIMPEMPGTITPDQAAAHIGNTATVCGKVYGVKFLTRVLPS